MKKIAKALLLISTISFVISCANTTTKAQSTSGVEYKKTLDSKIGKLDFDHDLPTAASSQKLFDELDFQRATQSVFWVEAAYNTYLFEKAMDEIGVQNLGAMLYNEKVHAGHEVLTPNQSVVYLFDNIDLRKTGGPVVYEVPAGPINAGFYDEWNRAFYDFGMVGPNRAKGDKILILPPNYEGDIPSGYQIAQAKTYQVYSITRVPLSKDMTAEKATTLLQQIKTYPLSDPTFKKKFVLMGDPATGGKEYRINRQKGLKYWEQINEVIQNLEIEERDLYALSMLREIGIEKGKPFNPDERLKKILIEAETIGHAMLVNEAFTIRYKIPDNLKNPKLRHVYDDTEWLNLKIMSDFEGQREENYGAYTPRSILWYQIVSVQQVWTPREYPPGFGQTYAAIAKDRDSNWFFGENTYKLHVDADVPAKHFWSLAIYDVETRSFIETEQRGVEFNNRISDLDYNEDGSVDLYLGPTAPEGKENNWVQTIPGKTWHAYFRWYGPTETFWDGSWKLNDFEKIN